MTTTAASSSSPTSPADVRTKGVALHSLRDSRHLLEGAQASAAILPGSEPLHPMVRRPTISSGNTSALTHKMSGSDDLMQEVQHRRISWKLNLEAFREKIFYASITLGPLMI